MRTIERLHVFLETNKKKLFNNTKVFCQLFDLSNLKETTKVKKVFNTSRCFVALAKENTFNAQNNNERLRHNTIVSDDQKR